MALRPVTFGKEAVDELKKVTWPTRSEVIRLTIAVLGISVIVGIFLGVIDFALEELIARIIA